MAAMVYGHRTALLRPRSPGLFDEVAREIAMSEARPLPHEVRDYLINLIGGRPILHRQVHNTLIDPLVDRVGAAKILGVSPRTLDRWHLLRIGPPRCLLGGQVRYRVEAIAEWVRSCEDAQPRPHRDVGGRS